MAAGALTTRIGSLLTQIVLVLLLVKEDFGVYAIVISFYLLLNSLRDAGVGHYLTHKSQEKFETLSGSTFWLAIVFNCALAILLFSSSFLIASYYDDERIVTLLGLLALSIPLRTPASILITKLSIDGKFDQVTKIITVSALLKFSLWILLAWLGFGPYSFVIPIPLVAIIEGIWAYHLTKFPIWQKKPFFSNWQLIINATVWILVGQFAIALLQGGDYLVLGLFLTKGLLGIYYFSFEIVSQIGVLLANNVQKVLFPSLTYLKGDKQKQQAQTLQALTIVMMLGPFLTLLIALIIEPIALLLGWVERFPGIVTVVQALALFFPLRVLTIFTTTILMTKGDFKKLAVINLIQGIGLLLISLAVCNFTNNLAIIALTIGIYLGGVSFIFATLFIRLIGISTLDIIRNSLVLWVVISGIAGVVYILNRVVVFQLLPVSNAGLIINIFISILLFALLYTFTMLKIKTTSKITHKVLIMLFRRGNRID